MHESREAQHFGLGFRRALESPLITRDKEHDQTFEGHLGHLGERLFRSKQTAYTFSFWSILFPRYEKFEFRTFFIDDSTPCLVMR